MALQNQYGLGYSPLSIKYTKENAYVQESVANKEVGLYGIVVNEDRDVVSAQYVARSKYQMETFVNRLIADNTIGRIYKILVDDQIVRTIHAANVNLLEDADISINNGTIFIKGVRFNFDLDWIVKNYSALAYNGDIYIKIVMRINIGSAFNRLIINDTINHINSKAYALDYTGLDERAGDVILSIESIEIIPPSGFDFDVNILSLYDILMAVIPAHNN